MSYKDCLACKGVGTKPKRGVGRRLVIDPRITMPGVPTLDGHRLGAEFMAQLVYARGLTEQIDQYNLSREELLVACWWAGTYGPRPLKKTLGAWAETAGHHLWYGCVQIPDPPQMEAKP